MNAAAPGWQPDPTGRHEYRYWNGSQWTDDVSDGGVTATDPLSGAPSGDPGAGIPSGAPAGGPAGYPSGDSAPPWAPGQQPPPEPGFGTPSGQGMGGPSYGGYPSGPSLPGQPVKKGPSTGLLVAIVVLAVVAIGGIAYAMTSGGDDDEGTDTAGQETTDGTGSEGTGSEGGGESNEALVQGIAEGVQQGSGGQITDEQATCVAQAMLDEFGSERLIQLGLDSQDGSSDAMSSLPSEDQAAIVNLMFECIPNFAELDTGTGT